MKHIKMFESFRFSNPFSKEPKIEGIPVCDISQPGDIVFCYWFFGLEDFNYNHPIGGCGILEKNDPLTQQILDITEEITLSSQGGNDEGEMDTFEESGIAYVSFSADMNSRRYKFFPLKPNQSLDEFQSIAWVDASIPDYIEHNAKLDNIGWVCSLKKGVITTFGDRFVKNLNLQDWLEIAQRRLDQFS